MSTPMTAQHIESLQKLGAAILPGTHTQPSFTAADPNADNLRRALEHLTFDAPVALTAVAGGVDDAAAFIDGLKSSDPDTFHSVWMVCVGAYYVNRVVWERLNYPGRIPYPVAAGEADSYIDPNHLQAVIDRGPIYRAAPS
jgi:hypothetical protein